jgi:hypothetical protein
MSSSNESVDGDGDSLKRNTADGTDVKRMATDWATTCKVVYQLYDKEDDNVPEFQRKLNALAKNAEERLHFLSGNERLYRKTVHKNENAEYLLRAVLHEYNIDIDQVWARSAATNCFPMSELLWDKFGDSYDWSDDDCIQVKHLESKKDIGEIYGRRMDEEPRVFLSLYPTEIDIALAILGEHLLPAAKKLRMIELFLCLYGYFGGSDDLGGWCKLDVCKLELSNCYNGHASFIDMIFFVVRVFGRVAMVLPRKEGAMLFHLVGRSMVSRIMAFNKFIGQKRSRKRKASPNATCFDFVEESKMTTTYDGSGLEKKDIENTNVVVDPSSNQGTQCVQLTRKTSANDLQGQNNNTLLEMKCTSESVTVHNGMEGYTTSESYCKYTGHDSSGIMTTVDNGIDSTDATKGNNASGSNMVSNENSAVVCNFPTNDNYLLMAAQRLQKGMECLQESHSFIRKYINGIDNGN